MHPGIIYVVHRNGRSIREKILSAIDMKIEPFHERPVEVCHEFKDEFAPGDQRLDLLRLPPRQHCCVR